MVVNNEQGLASIETMALLVIFAVLIGYGIGYFGIVHTGIMNSIAARSYAFETFDHRADLSYFRSNRPKERLELDHYQNYGFRAHGIHSEQVSPYADTQWDVTERSISIGRPSAGIVGAGNHDKLGSQLNGPEKRGVNPVWLKVVYGICVNFECGGAGS